MTKNQMKVLSKCPEEVIAKNEAERDCETRLWAHQGSKNKSRRPHGGGKGQN